MPGTWAPAIVWWPPPPSFSMMSWTFTWPMLRAEKDMPPFWANTRNDADTPLMLSSSSAAWAAVTWMSGRSGSGETAMAQPR